MTAPEGSQALRKYRLIAEIGRGGMADVYLSVVQGPAGFNKLVVLKKARVDLAADPEFSAMFLDEARLAARLNHPNVVQTIEVGQEDDRYFIAMEYLDGQPLHRARSRLGASLTLPMQVRILGDVLAGLHHAHELCDFDGTPLGVVHRDATPQNVFVTYDGLIKVVDFGIAKAVDATLETRTGVVKGKVPYMAPEQARGEPVDRRADIFAVGVMLFEAIAARKMWKGVQDMVVLQRLVAGEIPDVRQAKPDIDEKLAAICARALAPKREDRFETALEMHDALEKWLSGVEDRPTARDIGKLLGERYAEDRARVKGIIEEQLRDVRWSGAYPKITGVDLPKIDPGQIMGTPTGNRTVSGGSNPEIVMPGEGRRSGSSLTVQVTSPTAASAGVSAPRSRLPIVPIVVAAAVAAVVIFLSLRFLRPPHGPEAAAATTAPAGAAATQESVKLTVHVSPANAKVYLDDALLSAGPFEGKLVKNDKPHRLRVEAEHFASKEESLSLAGDMMLSISLEKEAESAPPASASAGASASAQAAPGGKPRYSAPAAATSSEPAPPAATPAPVAPLGPGQKPKRQIDSESPYAK